MCVLLSSGETRNYINIRKERSRLWDRSKDVIPLNFLQHLTPHYTEHLYSHLVENLYAHKTKTLDTIPVKQKYGRPPKPKSQISSSNPRTPTAAKNMTI